MADDAALTLVLSGALAMGYATAALFFAKFWRRSGSRIFAWFTIAFALLAVQRLVIALLFDDARSAMPWSYTLRVLAFVLILVGVAAQNRSSRRRRR
jgi:hypothetical protein